MPQRFEITSVTHEIGRIAFDWEDTGGTYHVYKDGEHVYEGTSTDFQDTDFTPGKLYKYTIERQQEGMTKDVIVMQTTPLSMEKNADNPLQSLVMTTIVAKSQVALSWERMKDVDQYTIYRNGEELAQVGANRFIDRDFPADEPLTYSIYCERPIAESEETFNTAKSVIAKVFGIFYPKTTEKKASVEGFTMMKSIGSVHDLLKPVEDTPTPMPVTHWHFRYKTFLEDDILENPNVLSPNRYFKGDNRHFDPESAAYRTSVDIDVDYSRPGSPLTFKKDVGESVAYGLDKKIRERDTASDEGIVMKQLDHGKGETGFFLEHAVGNPLTTAPDINYEVQAVFRENGTCDLTGYHDQSPDHEIYITKGKGSRWIPIHQSRSEGLAFMTEVTAFQYWRFSNLG
ncbi:hypothetical protein NCCP2716_09840 [Sporosarcina sp. NCCP-2716]|uniref:DUF3238 domain-containing protein n=1 Tax=Sporosarcina sp. NCCP-2716 TaxID=2943679 RepID=UPI002041E0AD|nr:DUF3238 domain-containing protein [Sporosarcina sp. NCCP-2716]GKV68486.1 hypothetical protein NCCP2716_09840 [Sporosarcina sp. NCCP-2716]